MNVLQPVATPTRAQRWPDFAHTGAHTPAGRYLRSFWQPVYVGSDLPVNRAVPVQVMNEHYTLFRGAGGKAQLVADRCAHRGTRLSTGRVEGDTLRCFYHGWRYDMNGVCVERPAESSCPDRIRVRSYPTREWVGFVFAYLGEGEPPPFQELAVFAGPGLLEASAPLRPVNYFQQLENGVDELHFNFVHRESRFAGDGLIDDFPVLTAEETDYGLARFSRRGDAVREMHLLMPNVGFTLLWGGYHLTWRVPVDDVSHRSFTVDLIPEPADRAEYERKQAATRARFAAAPPAADVAAAILRGEFTLADVADHPDLITVQDLVALTGQGTIADREHETLGTSDVHIVKLRRLWARDLAAIAAGGARKDWRWPAVLNVTSGASE